MPGQRMNRRCGPWPTASGCYAPWPFAGRVFGAAKCIAPGAAAGGAILLVRDPADGLWIPVGIALETAGRQADIGVHRDARDVRLRGPGIVGRVGLHAGPGVDCDGLDAGRISALHGDIQSLDGPRRRRILVGQRPLHALEMEVSRGTTQRSHPSTGAIADHGHTRGPGSRQRGRFRLSAERVESHRREPRRT